jgi:hypothetical protein
MLSFELKKPKSGDIHDELEIYLDRAGLDSLLAQLRFLKEGRTEHLDLMAESWGGTHLDTRAQADDATPIRYVKILLR